MSDASLSPTVAPRRFLSSLAELQWLGVAVILVFLGVTFIAPLAKVLLLSVTGDDGGATLENFRGLLATSSLRPVLLQTAVTSLEVTLACLVIGYPAAIYLSRLNGWRASLTSVAILFPFLTSSLVRTFVFIVLLGRNGVFNSALEWLGVPGAPFKLLFNQIGVVIGMTYVLLPYMLLSLIGTMRKIDHTLLDAARSLGASRARVFWTVYVPLSLPGVAAGAIITTILGFGYFVTPAMMGGPGERMIAQMVEQRILVMYDLPGAATISVVMLVIVLTTYAAAARWLGLSRLMRPQG
ncbi:ABC transporter permease [Tropicimonas isoalkanivorans]|uniref:Putative spermidine/putrescine transport system permease protein n=1 Tax=Tropicimonas isoalkanivorans TaxID=441112 RepID=A0A1I1HU08_9RHOB|nr:ABC transporter permease [Tropicimonas isoalkanivorans]SFC25438.1 putative spermidine/putrescine transport system permease protein [Tropicimonas isoalkanivorans]